MKTLVVLDGMSGSSSRKEYLKIECWEDFDKQFGFKSPGFHGIGVVNASDITLDDEYYECMSICVENNPALRSEIKWCDYVQRLDKTSASNLKALLHATRPSRMVSLAMSHNMLKSVAILCAD